MRKLMMIMAITAVASISTFQVVACKDDSLNSQFMADVNDSEKNNTAFFGFLGSADNDTSNDLQIIFDYWNQEDNDGNSLWKDWINDHKIAIEKSGLKNIYLKYYQGPSHDPVPSDPVAAFWDEKNIVWQKNIFDWVYSRANKTDNPYYNTPQGLTDVKEITTIKDNNEKERFQNLPIVFIVKNGHLVTAGENWIPISDNWRDRVDGVGQFILSNLFLSN